MGSGVWLRLLLALGALWGIGARETVLGTLGEATFLRIPRQLQERTQEFGEASWKKLTEELQRKKFLLKISGGNYTEFEPGRVSFHRRDFSLEILNTSRDDRRLYEYSVSNGQEEEIWQIQLEVRDDRRLYEYSVSNGQEEEIWQIQLEVFEPVAHPSIRILRRELSNGSCSLELRCTSERGDEVSYSWESRDNGTGGICSGNGSFLNLSYSLRNAGFGCVCTARNPVSSRDAAFDSSRCGFEQRGVPGLRPELLAPLLALAAVAIVTAAVVTFRATRPAKRDRDPPQDTPDPSPAAPDSAGATIYAQVQKPKGTVPDATTIYAAATGPPPGAPRSLPDEPPRGPPPLSQEPTTVYASVTLPVA
ncbi:PREDICTED: signaling lymphocytic activation molecule [Pseudopodoces humilis]|uniref:signaling lymphocytic activation molecule n=1 Tax=Pseudopodoces humilis TaxID=181119 RepID=UPI0006B7F189|nr:PREDICTED: signaling lymphocytic activation molecule [Pseudopodoces humilis]